MPTGVYTTSVIYLNNLLHEEGVLSAQTCLDSAGLSGAYYLFRLIDTEFFT